MSGNLPDKFITEEYRKLSEEYNKVPLPDEEDGFLDDELTKNKKKRNSRGVNYNIHEKYCDEIDFDAKINFHNNQEHKYPPKDSGIMKIGYIEKRFREKIILENYIIDDDSGDFINTSFPSQKFQLDGYKVKKSYFKYPPTVKTINGKFPFIFAAFSYCARENLWGFMLPISKNDIIFNRPVTGIVIKLEYNQITIISGLRSKYRLATYIYHYLLQGAGTDVFVDRSTLFHIAKKTFLSVSEMTICQTYEIEYN